MCSVSFTPGLPHGVARDLAYRYSPLGHFGAVLTAYCAQLRRLQYRSWYRLGEASILSWRCASAYGSSPGCNTLNISCFQSLRPEAQTSTSISLSDLRALATAADSLLRPMPSARLPEKRLTSCIHSCPTGSGRISGQHLAMAEHLHVPFAGRTLRAILR